LPSDRSLSYTPARWNPPDEIQVQEQIPVLTKKIGKSNSAWYTTFAIALVLLFSGNQASVAQTEPPANRENRSAWTPSLGQAVNPATQQSGTVTQPPPAGQQNTENRAPVTGAATVPPQQPVRVPPTSPDALSNQQPQQPAARQFDRTTELTDNTRPSGWQQTSDAGTVPAAPSGPPPEITRVSQTFDSLPNTSGQVWREYDIQPYTSQITGETNPQKAVIDAILRQTGREMWFHEPFGILNANRDKLFVYHTPEVHNQIRPILDRFMNGRGQPQTMELGLYTVGNPNWRTVALPMMQPIQLASPGVEAWVASKENAARIISQISSRNDFRSHASGRAIAHDGQEFTLARRTPEQFVRTIQWTPGQGAGYLPVLTQFNEGYDIGLAMLTTLDGQTIETFIHCNVDQIEKRTTVQVPVQDPSGVVTKINLQIPQIVSWRLEERIRWPVDQVLIVSCGVVAIPSAENVNRPLGGLLEPGHNRADALLFIDYRGPSGERPDGTTASNQIVPVRPR